ncbi:porin [Mesoterricola silvestris]|uniref:Porin n=1 Tax=Mesoterricola silvestris TaxID=2927979 RepID=A0AA48GS40_9BACT|nr:porin [Mesoterricola silvestris]BDU74650.1 porin [Mesoterricola silvestris]
MNVPRILGLSTALVAGCLQAQTVDVQAELASQKARIAELEKKVAPQAAAGPIVFPEALTPYILIDLTLVGKSNATADGRTKVDMGEPFFSGNRWGLKGLVKTNVDGLAVIYKLESEYFLYDGEQGKTNALFNRDAWVGISGKSFGKITIGRQNTLARDFAVIYCDPFNHAEVNYDEGGWTNNSNFKSLVYYAGAVSLGPVTGGPAQTRMDKGIVWKKMSDEGLCFGAAYNLNYEANTSVKNSTGSVALGWNARVWHVSGFYTQANNNNFTQKSMSLGGNVYVTPKLKINAGYFHYTAEQGLNHSDRTDNAYTLSGSYSLNPKWTLFAGVQTIKVDHAGMATATGAIPNAFANGANAAFYTTGSKDSYYAAVRRHLSRKIEAYVVYDYMKLHDAYKLSTSIAKDSQAEYGVGLRISAL